MYCEHTHRYWHALINPGASSCLSCLLLPFSRFCCSRLAICELKHYCQELGYGKACPLSLVSTLYFLCFLSIKMTFMLLIPDKVREVSVVAWAFRYSISQPYFFYSCQVLGQGFQNLPLILCYFF